MDSSQADFTEGSILKKLIAFMIPILGALVLQAAYGAVDLAIVGHFGTTAGLSAVSTGSQVLNMATFIMVALATGITVLIARYIGEKKFDRISPLIGSATLIFVIASAALLLIMIILARPLAHLLYAPDEALAMTISYIRICGGGIFFIIAYNVMAAIFRGLGDSRSPLIFVAIACLVNIGGDLLLVAGLHMDASGAAIATVFAQAVSVVFAIVMLLKKDLPFKIRLKDFRLNRQGVRFLKLGIPLAFQETLTQASFLAFCAFINKLGLEPSSGYGVACKIQSFIMLIPASLMQSMASFVSQNVGARKHRRALRSMFTGMGIGIVIGVPVALMAFIRGDVLVRLFTEDPGVIVQGFDYLRGFALEAVVTAILFSMVGYLNGNGRSLMVMLQGFAQTLLVRLPMAYLMSIRPDTNLTLIALSAPTATVFGICINLILVIYVYRKTRPALLKE